MLTIDSKGGHIARTNFWETELARAGKLYLSTNAGVFRLLVPPALESIVPELDTGRHAVVSRGPWPAEGLADALEVMLDDGSDNPFALHLSPESLDRLPLDEDAGKTWWFTVWTRPRRKSGVPHKALDRPAFYRLVDSIPWLKPRTTDAKKS